MASWRRRGSKRLDNYLHKKIFDYAKNRNEPILEAQADYHLI